MTDYNNAYHAVLEEIHDDIKRAVWKEVEKWAQLKNADLYIHVNNLRDFINEGMLPYRHALLQISAITSISVRDDAHARLFGLEEYL